MTAATPAARRPRVVCHMAASVDGRIVVDGWPAPEAVRRAYEQVHAGYEAGGSPRRPAYSPSRAAYRVHAPPTTTRT